MKLQELLDQKEAESIVQLSKHFQESQLDQWFLLYDNLYKQVRSANEFDRLASLFNQCDQSIHSQFIDHQPCNRMHDYELKSIDNKNIDHNLFYCQQFGCCFASYSPTSILVMLHFCPSGSATWCNTIERVMNSMCIDRLNVLVDANRFDQLAQQLVHIVKKDYMNDQKLDLYCTRMQQVQCFLYYCRLYSGLV